MIQAPLYMSGIGVLILGIIFQKLDVIIFGAICLLLGKLLGSDYHPTFIDFKVIHEGRGGKLICTYGKKKITFNIELGNDQGDFLIFTKGLSEKQRSFIEPELKKWLQENEKTGWKIEK